MKYSQFIIKPKKTFSFKDLDPEFTGDFKNKEEAEESLEKNKDEMGKYQDILASHEKYGLLLIFQGMDTAGKDPIIKHIMSAVDPQGCETKSFKAPTEKELRHDYLWRAVKSLPSRGQIGIFNRSYYEHVTGDRVHPERVDDWNLPDEAKGKNIWKRLYKEINNFEEYLTGNGIHVLKFYLNMSKEKQRERLLERIERSDKNHSFSPPDIEDRQLWDKFMKYYEEAITNTSTKHAPWYVIPDDHRWFAKAAISEIILEKLKSFHKSYPRIDKEQKKLLEEAKKKLEKERN